jgi:hypothetical protein
VFMKKMKALVAALAAAVLAGCVVTSVSPFYTVKDLAFEPGLVGNCSSRSKILSPRCGSSKRVGSLRIASR